MVPMNAFTREPDNLVNDQVYAIERVIRSGWWVLGKEVESFENEWATKVGSKYTVGVGNGMDALEIGLRALNIGEGDEVITTPMTAFATVLAILRAGALPVLADIDPQTGILDIESVKRCISSSTRAVMVVHLYGQAASLDDFETLCREYGLYLIEDCAQAHGAISGERNVGTVGAFAGWSFYPTKNLGTVGDGGAISTNDSSIDDAARQIRNYGQNVRYHHPRIGLNSRLDEIHAAILRVRLKQLDEWTKKRRYIARKYNSEISNLKIYKMPLPEKEAQHVHHLYVVKCRSRDALAKYLRENDVETLIHYPIPVHHQEPCATFRKDPEGLHHAECHAEECLSLPCNPFLTDEEIKKVIDAVNSFKE